MQELSLRDSFFNITSLSTLGVDPLLKYLATDRSQEIDTVSWREGVCTCLPQWEELGCAQPPSRRGGG